GLMSCKATSPSIAKHWVKFHWDQGIKANFVAEEYLPGRDYCLISSWNNGGLVTSLIREGLTWVGHRVVAGGGRCRLSRCVHSARLALEEEIPDCAKTNALPDDLWFTKNTDMGFTMVRGNHWKAAEIILARNLFSSSVEIEPYLTIPTEKPRHRQNEGDEPLCCCVEIHTNRHAPTHKVQWCNA